MNVRDSNSFQFNEMCDLLIKQLEQKYFACKQSETFSVFNNYIISLFGMQFEQKLSSEIQSLQKVYNCFIVADLLEQYKSVLADLDRSRAVYSFQKLIQTVNNESYPIEHNQSFEELLMQKDDLERKFKELDISAIWLKQHGLCGKGEICNNKVPKDVTPKKPTESIMQFLKRALVGISDYNQAIQIYTNGTKPNALLHDRLKEFRTYLITQKIVPQQFTENQLYNDVERVMK